jgi:hypothetical protein
MSVRFATYGAHTFYGGYRFDRWLAFVGMVQNPRTQYREAIIGVGTTVVLGGQGPSMLIGVALADATDAAYSQWYFLPTVRVGRWLLDGTVEGYLPLGRAGSPQLGATPANLVYRVSGAAAVGVSYAGGVQRGAPPTHAFGPSVRLTIPSGTLSIDALRALSATRSELRITALVSF